MFMIFLLLVELCWFMIIVFLIWDLWFFEVRILVLCLDFCLRSFLNYFFVFLKYLFCIDLMVLKEMFVIFDIILICLVVFLLICLFFFC